MTSKSPFIFPPPPPPPRVVQQDINNVYVDFSYVRARGRRGGTTRVGNRGNSWSRNHPSQSLDSTHNTSPHYPSSKDDIEIAGDPVGHNVATGANAASCSRLPGGQGVQHPYITQPSGKARSSNGRVVFQPRDHKYDHRPSGIFESARKVKTAPAVPNFSAIALPPCPTSSEGSLDHVDKKRKFNSLGLTPGLYTEGEEEGKGEEEAVDEEVVAGKAASAKSLSFVFKGKETHLDNPSELAAWLEERRNRYPTKRRMVEKLQQAHKEHGTRALQQSSSIRPHDKVQGQVENAVEGAEQGETNGYGARKLHKLKGTQTSEQLKAIGEKAQWGLKEDRYVLKCAKQRTANALSDETSAGFDHGTISGSLDKITTNGGTEEGSGKFTTNENLSKPSGSGSGPGSSLYSAPGRARAEDHSSDVRPAESLAPQRCLMDEQRGQCSHPNWCKFLHAGLHGLYRPYDAALAGRHVRSRPRGRIGLFQRVSMT